MGNLSISEEDCGIESPTILWASLVAQTVSGSEDLGSIPGLGRLPGEGNGNPLQYSCLENPMDGGAWCRLLSMGLHLFTGSYQSFKTNPVTHPGNFLLFYCIHPVPSLTNSTHYFFIKLFFPPHCHSLSSGSHYFLTETQLNSLPPVLC